MPRGTDMLARVDVLVAGRYVASRRLGHGLLGSANQRVDLLTERYTLEDVRGTPPADVQIAPDGTAIASGVAPLASAG